MPKSQSNIALDSFSPGIGGSYSKDPVTGELTLVEPPTAEGQKALISPEIQVPQTPAADFSTEDDQEIQS